MKLQFWGAAHTVTGSCFLLEAGGHKMLVDCGMFQGAKRIRELNQQRFHFNPAEIDFVLLTHAHIDHCGLLPKLCRDGFKGPVYATKATRELAAIMLPDSANIQESDAEMANRKGQRTGQAEVRPIYTAKDVELSLRQFRDVRYEETLELGPQIKAVFRDAGHILGSAMIEVYVTEEGETKKFLFSGDLGQPSQPIIKDPAIVTGADYLVLESTYGDRLHPAYEKDSLAEIINDSISRGGNLIIPAFAVGRTQTILYDIYKLWKEKRISDVPVIIDSPLAIASTRVFVRNAQEFDDDALEMLQKDGRLPQMPQLVLCETAEQSKELNTHEGPAIIISASGMADAGRVLHHLKHNLWRPESSVLFVGFQTEGSMGRRLLDGVKRVKIMGEDVSVRATIYKLDVFSAHADHGQIMNWLQHIKEPKPQKVFVVHGEGPSAGALVEKITEAFELSCYIPFYGDTITLDKDDFHIDTAPIPAVSVEKDMEEFLETLDSDYRQFRRLLLRIVIREPASMESVVRTVEKGWKYLKKLFNNFDV